MPSIDFAIRLMREADLPAVAQIEAGVFTDWYRAYRRSAEPLPERTLEELRYATSMDPEGNFVAIALDGSIVGFVFSRTWGRVGWFGTFGVPTQLQGLGIGRELLSRAVSRLRERADVVGLETMPESGTNLGLYVRAGFAAAQPTFVLELPAIHEAARFSGAAPDAGVFWNAEDGSSRKRLLAGMREVSETVCPGLDYSAEISAFREHAVGETIVSIGRGGRVEGFALLRTMPFREQDTTGRVYLHVLAARPGTGDERVLDDLLGLAWLRTTRLGRSTILTGVNGQHQDALEHLIARGFRARRAAIRMIHRGAPPGAFLPNGAIHCSRWAG